MPQQVLPLRLLPPQSRPRQQQPKHRQPRQLPRKLPLKKLRLKQRQLPTSSILPSARAVSVIGGRCPGRRPGHTLKGEGPFTVFAPTDEAFAALPAGTLDQLLADPKGQLTQILLYHVVPGAVMAADVTDGLEATTAQGSPVKFMVADGKVMINDANVVATDIAATNGVIHVIDKVILPPAAAEAAPAADAGVIPEVAAAAGNFSTLLAAVEAAGLADELSGEGPFTVFAPTDEAFAKIPADTLKALLADPQGQLAQILLYHVVSGKVMAADVKDGLEAETLQGAPLKFTVGADGSVKIGDVNVVATDVAASNGVIHVIDAVLMPPAK